MYCCCTTILTWPASIGSYNRCGLHAIVRYEKNKTLKTDRRRSRKQNKNIIRYVRRTRKNMFATIQTLGPVGGKLRVIKSRFSLSITTRKRKILTVNSARQSLFSYDNWTFQKPTRESRSFLCFHIGIWPKEVVAKFTACKGVPVIYVSRIVWFNVTVTRVQNKTKTFFCASAQLEFNFWMGYNVFSVYTHVVVWNTQTGCHYALYTTRGVLKAPPKPTLVEPITFGTYKGDSDYEEAERPDTEALMQANIHVYLINDGSNYSRISAQSGSDLKAALFQAQQIGMRQNCLKS